jgi:hypothetical protein
MEREREVKCALSIIWSKKVKAKGKSIWEAEEESVANSI